MAKIARDVMEKRIEVAYNFFLKNPQATVQELNDLFQRRGEKKMGAKAYEIRVKARRDSASGAKPPLIRRKTANGNRPTLVAPQEEGAKLAQDVLGILDGLAKRIAGSRITGIKLDLTSGVPVVALDELVPSHREIRLGESVASLRAPEAPRPSPAPAPQGQPVQPPTMPAGNVTPMPTNGGSQPS